MAQSARPDAPARPTRGRIAVLDTLRGLTIVSMVGFHFMFDYVYVYGFPAPWFADPVIQNIWRCSISWVFIALAGLMTSFSRSNLKRAAVYGAAALAVFLATALTNLTTPINFGILYCMAACTLVFCAVRPLLRRAGSWLVPVALIALFALCYNIPRATYDVPCLAWLGFPDAGFSSGDYYPLLPYVFLYLCFAWIGMRVKRYPRWMYRDYCHPLTVIGRHSLLIYLAHQVVIVAAFELFLLLAP